MFDYTIIIALCMAVFAAYNNPSFIGPQNAGIATFVLFLLYGASVIPFNYIFSYAFENHIASQVAIAGINFVIGFCLLVASFIMSTIASTKAGNNAAKPFYRLLPPYALGEGLINLASRPLIQVIDGSQKDALGYDIVGRDLLYLGCEAAAYYMINMMIELRLIQRSWIVCKRLIYKKQYNNNYDNDETDDIDIVAERNRVESELNNNNNSSSSTLDNNNTTDLVLIHHLRKQFPDIKLCGKPAKVAVNNLSLGIPSRECFGFLGTNGAGKSTTMNILSGDINPTSGIALIDNYDCITQREAIREQMGYCPQTDCLLDLMTAYEHLYMYARLRGLTKQQAHDRAELLVEQTGLTQYRNTVSHTYSGGNKRKLCLSISIIGEPKLVLLDEPSSGMDPLARRFMWELIHELSQYMSVVLTTHSMEEAEALCSRIGIMVNGNLSALGSVQHLKSRYGNGYILEIHVAQNNLDNVLHNVQTTFNGSVLTEQHFGHLKFQLPNISSSLSNIFQWMESQKQQYDIRDYAVSQTSLEQIFVQIAQTNNAIHD